MTAPARRPSSPSRRWSASCSGSSSCWPVFRSSNLVSRRTHPSEALLLKLTRDVCLANVYICTLSTWRGQTMNHTQPARGRGASLNPTNRFETLHYEPDPDAPREERPAPHTEFLKDGTRSIIATNESPDVGLSPSINPYHEYIGFSAGLDFETKILVKEDAPALLRKELLSKRWTPQVLGMSGVTDCYQPIERHLLLTRRCLQVLAEFRNPVAIVTKNHLVTDRKST